MDTNENRRPRVGTPRNGGSDYVRSSSANVVDFPSKFNATSPFQQLTARLVIAQHRAGCLPEAVIVALLVGAGLRP
jgi:hypothetical protein